MRNLQVYCLSPLFMCPSVCSECVFLWGGNADVCTLMSSSAIFCNNYILFYDTQFLIEPDIHHFIDTGQSVSFRDPPASQGEESMMHGKNYMLSFLGVNVGLVWMWLAAVVSKRRELLSRGAPQASLSELHWDGQRQWVTWQAPYSAKLQISGHVCEVVFVIAWVC